VKYQQSADGSLVNGERCNYFTWVCFGGTYRRRRQNIKGADTRLDSKKNGIADIEGVPRKPPHSVVGNNLLSIIKTVGLNHWGPFTHHWENGVHKRAAKNAILTVGESFYQSGPMVMVIL
jgi:hypothetical protein